MAHLGSIDTKNKDYHQRKDDDDDDKMNSAASSPESIPLSAEGNASSFYKKRQARSAMYDKDNKFAKQRRFRKRCLLVFSVICFFVCGCVFIRLWKSSSMLKDSQTTEGTTAVLTFDSWQDVTTKSAAAYRLSMSNGSESLRERENLEKIEAVNVETKNPIHVDGKRKKKRTKSAVLIYKTRSNWSQQSGVYSLPSSTKASTRWDVNAPPVRLPDGVNLKSRNKRKEGEYSVKQRRGPGSSTEGGGRGEGDLALIQKANSNEAPNTPGVPLHASEALQCRESVINFVINATDGKDECDGLIKAFDKTCSNDETDTHDSRRRRQLENRRQPPSPSRHRKRRLWDKLHVPYAIRLRALAYRTSRTLERSAQCLFRMLGSAEERSPFFFAEDEVFKAWDVAQYFVANSLDGLIQSVARSSMYKEQCLLYEREEDEKRGRQMRQLEEKLEEEVSHELPPLVTDKAKGPPSSTALQLPIKSQQHVSEKTANDALLLQQGEKIIKAANESLVAKEEAAKSKKSISATSDAVSAVLNDPSSVEARTCCASILNVYHELCSSDVEEQVSDKRLFFLVFIMACCGMVKSLIRHFRILWLPEAAGCIIVGVLSGYALDLYPHHDISFDGNWFLRILVPPIIFEAALSIDKRSFNRHIVPILIYAVAGTLVATLLTAMIVHYGTNALAPWCTPIPYVEALTFGALISSIDPIAVLSVLSNMGMNDTDTIYVLIFGESLLNDGVAIVLFHTLVHFLDETLIIDREAIFAATVHFFVVAFGSLLVGVASGMMSTVYFWIFYGCQTPLVEVLMFVCWALLPYYVCDGIGWSGIVAAVAVGFVMDLHIVGQQRIEEDIDAIMDLSEQTATSHDSNGENKLKFNERNRRGIFNRHGHLSTEARAHVGFVTEIISTGMETAIFAYLGFFLFSHRYHWNVIHTLIAILACCVSRAVMIPSLGFVANWITRIQQKRVFCRTQLSSANRKANNRAGVIVDRRMQIALWFAGLRGAMSFALVEHIPLYDSFSGEGTRLKPELKAMTSASIMFTVFVLGGYTYYMMEKLGIAPSNRRTPSENAYEIAALINKGHDLESDDDETETMEGTTTIPGKMTAFRRQRQKQDVDSLLTI